MKRQWIQALLLFCLAGSARAQLAVPLNHRVYAFLERMQTRGLTGNDHPMHGPLTRETIGNLLAEMENRVSSGVWTLSSAENGRFQELKGEFSDALPASTPFKNDLSERRLYSWKDGENSAGLDGYFEQALESQTGDALPEGKIKSLTTAGFYLRGKIKNSFGFFLFARNTLIRGESLTERFDPSRGMPVTVSGENAYSDDATAVLSWNLPWFSLTFGRDQARWGPGNHGLMLSATNPSFTRLTLSAELGRVRFLSIHGKLHSGEGSKFVAAHRLEIRPFAWAVIGGGETVVYGGRFEPAYFNPLMPFHVAEHHLGDRDNNTLGIDLTLFPLRDHRAYVELFIDDMTTARNLFTYAGNKFAFLAGWHWTRPFGWANGEFLAEYTRIEPYVYTHFDPVIVYSNYDRCIGHWLGPNADHLRLKIGWWITKDLSLDLISEQIRKGEGDLFSPRPYGTESKAFLGGTVEIRRLAGFRAAFQLFRDGFLALQMESSDIRNAGLVPGKGERSLFAFLLFQMNY